MLALAERPDASDASPQEQQRLNWLQRAWSTLEAGRQAAEADTVGDADALARAFKSLLEAAGTAEFLRGEDRSALTERSKEIERTAYERSFEQVLAQGRSAIRTGDPAALAPFLKRAGDLMAELRRRGTDQAGYDGMKEKLAILRETASPGESAKAKAPEKGMAAKPYLNDRRMFVRYTDPILILQIAGQRFTTFDWSLGGVLIGGVDRLPAAIGSIISLRMKVEAGHWHDEKATVARYDADCRRLALRFRRFGSALVMIKKECEALGFDPC